MFNFVLSYYGIVFYVSQAEFLKEQVAFFLQMQMQNSKENQVNYN
jgi:hypothetical protein